MPEDNSQLHVFSNDVVEWVIAYNQQDAVKVWEETVGEKYDPEESGEFVWVDDEKEFTLEDEMNREPIPAGAVLVESYDWYCVRRATCRAWADAFGRSYLGSTLGGFPYVSKMVLRS